MRLSLPQTYGTNSPWPSPSLIGVAAMSCVTLADDPEPEATSAAPFSGFLGRLSPGLGAEDVLGRHRRSPSCRLPRPRGLWIPWSVLGPWKVSLIGGPAQPPPCRAGRCDGWAGRCQSRDPPGRGREVREHWAPYFWGARARGRAKLRLLLPGDELCPSHEPHGR